MLHCIAFWGSLCVNIHLLWFIFPVCTCCFHFFLYYFPPSIFLTAYAVYRDRGMEPIPPGIGQKFRCTIYLICLFMYQIYVPLFIFTHCFHYFYYQLWHQQSLDMKVSDKKVWMDIHENQQWTATRVYWPWMNALWPVIRVSRGRVNSNCLVVTVWWRVGTSFTHAEINWMSPAFELLCHCSPRLWCQPTCVD